MFLNDPFMGALCPSESGLMNKHIVKQTYRELNISFRVFHFLSGALFPVVGLAGSVLGVHFEFLMLGSVKVKCCEMLQCFIFGALCPSKSGLIIHKQS